MIQKIENLTLSTAGAGLLEITNHIEQFITKSRIKIGLATIYSKHTSCSLLIQENADPDVQYDLQSFFRRLVPEDQKLYIHQIEGRDDMPAHIKTALTQTSLSIPISDRKMMLGRWQGIYLFEHRCAPQKRGIMVHLLGET